MRGFGVFGTGKDRWLGITDLATKETVRCCDVCGETAASLRTFLSAVCEHRCSPLDVVHWGDQVLVFGPAGVVA